MKMTSFRLRIVAQTLPFLLIAPVVALAQTPPSRAEASAAMHATANPGAEHFTRQQLDQMLAPIALYPDQLLSSVLMAATYPQQVLDAAQWLQDAQHKDLKGDELASALEPLPWDPSVKALVPFPQILAMMADHIEWTQALGTAFAEDQSQVMARIQTLRQLAMKSGKVKTLHHLNVREESGTVVITSAEPNRIYVPIYNPTVVYGEAWPDRDYPPVYLPPPQGFVAETIEPGLEISVGYAVVGPLWGWSRADWRSHRITIERDRYTRITRNAQIPAGGAWVHTGPVVLIAPSEARRSTTATSQVPAGTVAPGQAAAPRAVATQSTARPGTQPAQTTTQPNPAQPAQNQTTTAQPSASQPAQGKASTAQPSANQPAQSKTTTAQPSANRPTQSKATAAQPTQPSGTASEPAKTGASAAKPATSKPPTENAGRREEQKPGEARRVHEPAQNATAPKTPPAPAGNAARQEERNRATPREEGASRAPEQGNPPAANEPPGRERAAPGSGASQGPARREREPNQPQVQAPTPAAPPHQAERVAPQQHQPPAQGSSMPPAAAPAAQRPQLQPQAAPHPAKGEDEQKKEH